jgi:DNA replication and repair protein RecF
MLKDKKKQSPILLLDDIFDKLDVQRVTYLLQLLIQEKFGQIFITDTHEHRVEQIIKQFESNYYRYLVENGSLKKLN